MIYILLLVPTTTVVTGISPTQNSIEVTWTSSGAEDYIIYYMKTGLSTSTGVQAITTRQSLYTVTGLDSNTAYTFKISARNTLGVVNNSDFEGFTTPEGNRCIHAINFGHAFISLITYSSPFSSTGYSHNPVLSIHQSTVDSTSKQ